jgi:hypothetical protein
MFHIIIYITSILSAEHVNISYGNDKETYKFTVTLEPVYNNDNSVTFKMRDYDYFPCFAFLYSENKEIAEFAIGFYDDDFEDWCFLNFSSDNEYYLWDYFTKLNSGEIKFKIEKRFLTNKKQLELIVGVIDPKIYKSILTNFTQGNADLGRKDFFNFSAKAALKEKMIKKLESKIIYYGLRFSGTSDDNLPNLKDYKVFFYGRKEDCDPSESYSQFSFNINGFNYTYGSHTQMPVLLCFTVQIFFGP